MCNRSTTFYSLFVLIMFLRSKKMSEKWNPLRDVVRIMGNVYYAVYRVNETVYIRMKVPGV